MDKLCNNSAFAVTTEAQLNTPPTETVLPASGVGRTPDGRLTEDSLQGIYDTLTRNGKLMSLQTYRQKLSLFTDTKNSRESLKNELESIGSIETATINNMASEFCYYYNRYKFALQDLFDTLVATSTATTELQQGQKDLIKTKLDVARNFNTKLNDLIQIVNYIAIKRAEEMRDQNTEINSLNASIKEMYDKLQKANAILKREDADTLIRRRMVEYTQEKNLSANSLLSLYGFLNLVALGLLFYISRS